MRKLTYLTLLTAAAAFVAFSTSSLAFWGGPKSLEGEVQSIQSNIVTFTAPSVRGGAAQVVSVEVNDETRFGQLASLNELNTGDRIQVRYTEDQGKKIATMISLAESEAPMTEPQASSTPDAAGGDLAQEPQN